MESCKHTQKDLISCMSCNAGAAFTLKRAMLRLLRWRIRQIIAMILTVLRWAELWRRGSVVGSWLLDLTADVLRGDRELSKFDGGVSDSGEGRWTVHAAVDLGVPSPVISSALWTRFESRRLGAFVKVLNGMRAMFGGHDVG